MTDRTSGSELGSALGPATTTSPDDQPRRYVYGIIRSEELELDVDGVGDADQVYTLDVGPYAVVVSNIDSRDPDQTDENSRAHDEVLRAVMKHGDGRTVVPMRFGMVFEHDRAIENVIRGSREPIESAFRELEGSVELGVKVVAPTDGIEDPESTIADIVEELGQHAQSAADGDLFSDRLLLNRSFLVDREDRPAFDEAVDRVEEAHPELQIQYTGPWAPYSFVDIEVGVQQ